MNKNFITLKPKYIIDEEQKEKIISIDEEISKNNHYVLRVGKINASAKKIVSGLYSKYISSLPEFEFKTIYDIEMEEIKNNEVYKNLKDKDTFVKVTLLKNLATLPKKLSISDIYNNYLRSTNTLRLIVSEAYKL